MYKRLVLIRRSSQDGSILQNVRVQKNGLRSVRMEWGKEKGSSLHCAQEVFGEKLRELLCMDDESPKGGDRQ